MGRRFNKMECCCVLAVQFVLTLLPLFCMLTTHWKQRRGGSESTWLMVMRFHGWRQSTHSWVWEECLKQLTAPLLYCIMWDILMKNIKLLPCLSHNVKSTCPCNYREHQAQSRGAWKVTLMHATLESQLRALVTVLVDYNDTSPTGKRKPAS